MPQPNLPPTPASSTELLAKDLSRSSLDNAFALPPPALQDISEEGHARTGTSSSSEHNGMSSPELKTRPRRASTTKTAKQPLELPPPPSRSRKIIQMKPKTPQHGTASASTGETSTPAAGKTKAEPAPVAGTKRKAAGTSSAAGRKIARKTAHSLIERRRRSKMNEEFATLKNMVPACRGHEMHKLAILQASIDYLRYLQDCIDDLKAERTPQSAGKAVAGEMQTSPAFSPISSTAMSTPYLSPELAPQRSSTSLSQSQMPTPKLTSQDDPADFSTKLYSHSQLQAGEEGGHQSSASPLMTPKDDSMVVDADQNEATAALLMLNRDRRLHGSGSGGKAGEQKDGSSYFPSNTTQGGASSKPRSSITGMSVRELLS